ncbi:MAG: DNA-binding LytR/AlgR family response regulator [Arcticibacterium sp.]|jgi:DNA-binding LytR/AlgR family response regulator
MKLKSIIVEDDLIARRTLEHLCGNHDSIQHVESFESAEEALLFLETVEVDLIWLDVQMKGLSGFDLIKRLTIKPFIVMTTSNPEYAFEAYQHDISDYIQKPISLIRFKAAVDKAVTLKKLSSKKDIDSKVVEDIFVKVDKKYVRLGINDISYIENLSDYAKIYTSSKDVHVIHSTLKSLNEKLGDRFFRVHRTYLVNLSKIQDVDENNLIIEGKVIPISRRVKAEFLEKLNIL